MIGLGLWKIPLLYLLELVGWVLLPVVLLFVPSGKEELPKWCRWFDNFSGPGVDGLAGDKKHRVRNKLGAYYFPGGEIPFSSSFRVLMGYRQTTSWLRLYYIRYMWLGFRNACDYAKGFVFGYKGAPFHLYRRKVNNKYFDGHKLKLTGNNEIGDRDHSGLRRISLNVVSGHGKAKILKEYYLVSKPYTLFKHRLCLRFRVGYKVKEGDLAYQSSHKGVNQRIIRWEFSINPFQPYRGL